MININKSIIKFFFFQLGAIITLYLSFGTLINLIFKIIDINLKQDLNYIGYPSWSLAIIFILFPVYFWLMISLKRNDSEEEKFTQGVFTNFVNYLTLFIAGILFIGNLTTLLYYYFDGQILTLNFIAKSISLLLLSALIFIFYFWELRNRLSRNKLRIFSFLSIFIVVSIITGTFISFGSPAIQRLRRIDALHLDNLNRLQNYIIEYVELKNELPKELADLEIINFYNIKWGLNPETEQEYFYEKLTENEFKLCADFKTSNQGREAHISPAYYYKNNWEHDFGYQCFNLNSLKAERALIQK